MMKNPYAALADVKAELKIPSTDVSKDARIEGAIVLASRFIDDYKKRDFFAHDHRGDTPIVNVMAAGIGSVPLVLDQFNEVVYDRELFSPVGIVREIFEIKECGTVLVQGTDFLVRTQPNLQRRIFRLKANWQIGEPPTNVVQIKGKFGGNQFVAKAPIVTGAPGNFGSITSMVSSKIHEKNSKLYLRVTGQASPAGVRLDFYSDAGRTLSVAEMELTQAPTIGTIAPLNGTGYSGTASIGTFIGTDANGVVQLQGDVVDDSLVPTDLPAEINLACRLIAAALSGENRKEIVGLDGTRFDVIERTIPKTVFDILGKKGSANHWV